MKKYLKLIAILIGSILGLIIAIMLILFLIVSVSGNRSAKKFMAMAGPEVSALSVNGHSFRDLNKNGNLNVYEDVRENREARIKDLLEQMTLEEKAGLMFIPPVGMKKNGFISEKPDLTDLASFMSKGTSEMVFSKNINHFNIFMGTGKKEMAEWYNRIQNLASRSRLGIPVTIASDPRNSYSTNFLASAMAGDFSLWPEPLGLAATRDSALAFMHADMARREYLAAGIRVALHPMADLATEPRWGRINGTFGEDAELGSRLTFAYIKGFQGDTLGENSVACMTKHFSGGGPQKEGIDPHFPIAKGQIYPGNNFDGVVCTDWGLITDLKLLGLMVLPARARGMEDASEEERMLKIIDAGCDQFGGEMIPEMLVNLVKAGKITEVRLDSSVVRLLRVKFTLGLFNNPYVDVELSEKIIGNREFVDAGKLAQRKSVVLLKNGNSDNEKILPLKEGTRIFVMNIDTAVASKYGKIVESPEIAEVAIIRIKAPSQFLKGSGLLGRLFSSGDLDFKEKNLRKILKVINKVPSVVNIYLDRPAVIPEISSIAKGLIADFGAEDEAVLDVIFGRFNPSAKLPFEMPSSMDAVRNQNEDAPYDSKNPLFPFGYGLSY